MSGCGLVSASFRARPTRTPYRRALERTPERGNETACTPKAAASEPVASRPHTNVTVERSILRCFPLAWENRKGGTPFARFFPPFLAGQEMEPPEAFRKHRHKLQYVNTAVSVAFDSLFSAVV